MALAGQPDLLLLFLLENLARQLLEMFVSLYIRLRLVFTHKFLVMAKPVIFWYRGMLLEYLSNPLLQVYASDSMTLGFTLPQ